MARNSDQDSHLVVNIISSGTTVKGEITTNDDFRIDGVFEGTFSSSAKLVIGPSGKVTGNIYCQTADFSGIVKADVSVQDLLVLKASSQLVGNIAVGKISIEPNARFCGKCSMEVDDTL